MVMRRLILVAMLAVAMSALAFAKTVKNPDDNTVAIVTIPDAWTINEMDEGVEVTSPDISRSRLRPRRMSANRPPMPSNGSRGEASASTPHP